MAMPVLIMGNRAYSSWSLRGWLALKRAKVAFEARLVPLDLPETAGQLAALSPSGKVPCLCLAEGFVIWEALAILEWASETLPAPGLWPSDPIARATARAAACEMHAGFEALRRDLPMDLKSDCSAKPPTLAAGADITRLFALWRDCRSRFGKKGPYLFGPQCCGADIAFAPVIFRLTSYAVALPADIERYAQTMLALPEMRAWQAAARAEPWVIRDP